MTGKPELVIGEAEMLADRLRGRVAPAIDSGGAEHAVVVFAPRHFGIAPINLGGRAEHHFLVVLVGGLEDVLGAVDIDVQRLVGIAYIMFYADHGGEVIDEIGLRDQAVDQFEVENRVVDVVEARIVEQMADLADRAGIEHEHLVAARDECVGDMRAQKSRSAGDENLHIILHLTTRQRIINARHYKGRRGYNSARGRALSAPRTSRARPSAAPSNCTRFTIRLPCPAAISIPPSRLADDLAGLADIPSSFAMRVSQMKSFRPAA